MKVQLSVSLKWYYKCEGLDQDRAGIRMARFEK